MSDQGNGKRELNGHGELVAIWSKRVRRGPMDRRERGQLLADSGLEGDVNRGSYRQVTVISEEDWTSAAADVGDPTIDPAARRANLMIRGLPLAGIRNRILAVGAAKIEILNETRPCNRMEEAAEGLRTALAEGARGGSWGRVVAGGEIAVGDPVRWEGPTDGAVQRK